MRFILPHSIISHLFNIAQHFQRIAQTLWLFKGNIKVYLFLSIIKYISIAVTHQRDIHFLVWRNRRTFPCLHTWRGFAGGADGAIYFSGGVLLLWVNAYFTMHWMVFGSWNLLWMFMHFMYVLFSCYFQFRKVLFC